MNQHIMVIFTALVFGIGGCSAPSSPDDYSNQLVLNAFLFAGSPIDSIYVQRTARMLEFYSDEVVAVREAVVKISLMQRADPTSIESTFVLIHDENNPGRYFSAAIISPLRTYAISVQALGYPTVTGVTTVPDTFHVTTVIPPTLAWDLARPSIVMEWTPSNHHSDYVVSINCLEPTLHIIEDFRSKNRPKDEPLPERTSFLFNNPKATFKELPWLMFNYLGLHSISVSAVDENYYSFLQQTARGGGSLREIQYRLNGGIGVFGSSAKAFFPQTVTLTQ